MEKRTRRKEHELNAFLLSSLLLFFSSFFLLLLSQKQACRCWVRVMAAQVGSRAPGARARPRPRGPPRALCSMAITAVCRVPAWLHVAMHGHSSDAGSGGDRGRLERARIGSGPLANCWLGLQVRPAPSWRRGGMPTRPRRAPRLVCHYHSEKQIKKK